MPAPIDFSTLAGWVRIFARVTGGEYHPTGQWQEQSDWDCTSVKIGSGDRVSTAELQYSRERALYETGFTPPSIYPDVLFAIAWQNSPTAIPIMLFEGVPGTLNRGVSGTPGNSHDTGSLALQSSSVAWADHPESQIYGRFMPRVPEGTSNGTVINDPSLPCVFNDGGRPNRSVRTCADTKIGSTNIFQPADRLDSHYFTFDDGWDIYEKDNEASTRRARYWTYGQAIAYVLHRYCFAVSGAVLRNGVRMKFGAPPTTTPGPNDSDTLWGAIIGPNRADPFFKREALGELYEGDVNPPPETLFDPRPARLLRAKCSSLSIQGMNAIEALNVLFRGAGLGTWVDQYVTFSSVSAPPPENLESTMRAWSPGGKLASPDGIGDIYTPKLEPPFTSMYSSFGVARTAADIFSRNNVETIDQNSDAGQIVNTPIIVAGPTRYEITAQLRPGWRPLHHVAFGLWDNVNPANTIPNGGGSNPPVNELDAAIADGPPALMWWQANPEQAQSAIPGNILDRVKALAKRLHARGPDSSMFYDIGRKWVIPTDLSYPTPIYGRENITGVPWFWKTYKPADFSAQTDGTVGAENWITEAIPEAATWPSRRMEFLPCLSADASGRSVGIKVDVSFDSGVTWTPWNAFRVIPGELAIHLGYESPFEIQNPRLPNFSNPNEGNWYQTGGNYYYAYIHHKFRVRITAAIEAPSALTVKTVGDFITGTSPRSRVFNRQNRYGHTELRSQFKTRVTDDITALAAYNDTTLNANNKLLFYKRRDDTVPMTAEGYRTQALLGDWQQSNMLTIPWLETSVRPGAAVPYVEEMAGGDTSTRQLDFRSFATEFDMCPHVAGVVYTFARGGIRTSLLLNDWRTMAEVRG